MRIACDGFPAASVVRKIWHDGRPSTDRNSPIPASAAAAFTPSASAWPCPSIAATGSGPAVGRCRPRTTARKAAKPVVSAPFVLDSRNTRGRSVRKPPSSINSRRPANAATENPLPIALPQVDRSGITPYTACAPPAAQRNPVIVSSKTRTAPCRSHSARTPARYPGAGSARAEAASRITHATGSSPRARPGATPGRCSGSPAPATAPRGHPAVDRQGADEPVLRGEVGLVLAHRHELTPGRRAGQAQRGTRGVGGVLAELHHVRARHEAQEILRGGQLQLGRAG